MCVRYQCKLLKCFNRPPRSFSSSSDSLILCVWRRWSTKQTGTEMEKWTRRSSCGSWRKPAFIEGRGNHWWFYLWCCSYSISTSLSKSLSLCCAIHFHLKPVFRLKLFSIWAQCLVRCQYIYCWFLISSTIAKNTKRKPSFSNAAYFNQYTDDKNIQVYSQCLYQRSDKHFTFQCFD